MTPNNYLQNRELFSSKETSYQALQKISQDIDQLFGFNVEHLEQALVDKAKEHLPNGNKDSWGDAIHEGNQTWVGLTPAQLQTTYQELYDMCSLLRPDENSHFIDLGAGYGRMGLVLSAFAAKAKFTGIEYVGERVDDGNEVFKRYGLDNCKLIKGDLTASDFELPEGTVYFIYDYGKREHIKKTIEQIDEVAFKFPFKVIARGRGTRTLIDYHFPSLSEIYTPIHRETFSIYSTY